MNRICIVFLNFVYFFQINAGNNEIHTVKRDSNNISLFSWVFYRKSVGLSSRRTIDMHPSSTTYELKAEDYNS